MTKMSKVFEIGDRVKLTKTGKHYLAERGLATILEEVAPHYYHVVFDKSPSEDPVGVFSDQIKKVKEKEAVEEEAPEFKVGDRVRLTGKYWDDGFLGLVVEVTGFDGDGDATFDHEGEEYYIFEGWEAELVTTEDENWHVEQDSSRDYDAEFAQGGYTGTTGHPVGSVHGDCYIPAPKGLFDIEKLRAALGVGLNDGEDFVSAVEEFSSDAIAPEHYAFPGGVRVHQISTHLTSCGGQAVQYVARSTRLDGNNKGNPVENLRKAIKFLEWEIERLEAAE